MMTAPTLAWSEAQLFELPDATHLFGREFDLLPGGSMFAAHVILHGIVGVQAVLGCDDVARVAHDAPLVIYGIRGTVPEELATYETDILDGYRIRIAQDVQG